MLVSMSMYWKFIYNMIRESYFIEYGVMVLYVLCLFPLVSSKSNEDISSFREVYEDFTIDYNKLLFDDELEKNAKQGLTCVRPDVYQCELHLNVDWDLTKICNYRSGLFYEQAYKWWTGYGCFIFSPDNILQNGTSTLDVTTCVFNNQIAPCMQLPKSDGSCGCYPFDPDLEVAAEALEAQYVASARERWPRCARAAGDCCRDIMDNTNVFPSAESCPATWDGWSCWENESANSVAQQVCAEFAYSNTGPTCEHFSSKECYANSTWEVQTDYSTCSVSSRLIARNQFYVGSLCASLAACVPAVLVLAGYRRLRVPRVALHRNLLVAIVVRNVLVILARTEVYFPELRLSSDTPMQTNAWWCRALAAGERAAAGGVFACMLAEGVFLHRRIAATFRGEPALLPIYAVGLGITGISVVAWIIVMALLNDSNCWMVYSVSYVQWIIDAPRLLMLLVNTCLLVDIMRVLLTKLQRNDNSTQLSTAKATLFLMPLFGVQVLLTAYRPASAACVVEDAYFYFAYAMEAMQGVMVATLYCYWNKEVHLLIKATYKKTETAVITKARRVSSYRPGRPTQTDRRATMSTMVDNQMEAVQENDEQMEEKDEPKQNTTTSNNGRAYEIRQRDEYLGSASVNDDLYKRKPRISNNWNSLPSPETGETNPPDHKQSYSPEIFKSYSRPTSLKLTHDDTSSQEGARTVSDDNTVECYDWIKCISSPTSSIYENSLDEYEIQYLKKKMFQLDTKAPTTSEQDGSEIRNSADDEKPIPSIKECESFSEFEIPHHIVESMDGSRMFDEILEKASGKVEVDDDTVDTVVINADVMFPNRPKNDRIIFLND